MRREFGLPTKVTEESPGLLGAVEAGGTKFRVGVGATPTDYEAITIPTTTPDETLGAVVDFLKEHRPATLGIATFGPADVTRGSATYGTITATPKLEWQQTDLKGRLDRALGTNAAVEIDVGAAGLAEWLLGAARGCETVVYLTIGTGIGGAYLVDGEVQHGAGHSEMGHIVLRREPGDEYDGMCPYHGDCLEGLASGPALAAREAAPWDGDTMDLAARYLAQALRTFTYVIAPDRIVLGGGVTQRPELLAVTRTYFVEQLADYSAAPAVTSEVETYLVDPHFGQDAGLVGAFLLADAQRSG